MDPPTGGKPRGICPLVKFGHPALFMNLSRSDDIKRSFGEKAGMDEATIVGLRERVHSGLLPHRKTDS